MAVPSQGPSSTPPHTSLGSACRLSADPTVADAVLDDGLTLLHTDALAGNLGPVQALLRSGADQPPAHHWETPLSSWRNGWTGRAWWRRSAASRVP